MSEMHAVILAGGKGSRLRPYTTTLPKPLMPIGDDCSILEIVLRQLARHGFVSVTVAIGHLGQLIQALVGDGSQWGLEVDYATEDQPLGTIGPVLQGLNKPVNDLSRGALVADIVNTVAITAIQAQDAAAGDLR